MLQSITSVSVFNTHIILRILLITHNGYNCIVNEISKWEYASQCWKCPLKFCNFTQSFKNTHHISITLQTYESTNTHTRPFNGPLSRTTQVSRYQKGKTNLDFTEARDSEWQWHRLGHMQVCTSLQTDNHTSTPPLSFLQALPAAQPTVSKHWRQDC